MIHKKFSSGDIYRGESKDGTPHGFGELITRSGITYRCEFAFGKKHGIGKELNNNSEVYFGQFKDDQRHGIGVVQQTNSSYLGQFELNKINGYGELKKNNGSHIIGEFKDGIPNGCVMFTTKGAYFFGMFRKGLPNGFGIERLEYEEYQGQFIDGERRGVGKLLDRNSNTTITTFGHHSSHNFSIVHYSTGGIYKGFLQSNRRSGIGQLSGKGFSYIGNFKDGDFDGFGKMTNSEYVYIGDFKNSLVNGIALQESQDKDSQYFGQWKQGKRHGFGILRNLDRIFFGNFVNGEKLGPGVIQVGEDSTPVMYFENGEFSIANSEITQSISKKREQFSIKAFLYPRENKLAELDEIIHSQANDLQSIYDEGYFDLRTRQNTMEERIARVKQSIYSLSIKFDEMDELLSSRLKSPEINYISDSSRVLDRHDSLNTFQQVNLKKIVPGVDISEELSQSAKLKFEQIDKDIETRYAVDSALLNSRSDEIILGMTVDIKEDSFPTKGLNRKLITKGNEFNSDKIFQSKVQEFFDTVDEEGRILKVKETNKKQESRHRKKRDERIFFQTQSKENNSIFGTAQSRNPRLFENQRNTIISVAKNLFSTQDTRAPLLDESQIDNVSSLRPVRFEQPESQSPQTKRVSRQVNDDRRVQFDSISNNSSLSNKNKKKGYFADRKSFLQRNNVKRFTEGIGKKRKTQPILKTLGRDSKSKSKSPKRPIDRRKSSSFNKQIKRNIGYFVKEKRSPKRTFSSVHNKAVFSKSPTKKRKLGIRGSSVETIKNRSKSRKQTNKRAPELTRDRKSSYPRIVGLSRSRKLSRPKVGALNRKKSIRKIKDASRSKSNSKERIIGVRHASLDRGWR